jgi:hypothetical protein
MQVKPTCKREEEIAERVDQKARAIRDGVGAWDKPQMCSYSAVLQCTVKLRPLDVAPPDPFCTDTV